MKRAKILLGIVFAAMLALMLGACAAGSSSASSASSSAESDSSASQESSSESADASSSSESASSATSASSASAASSASTQSTSAGSEGFDFQDECIDEHGNITLYALTELKGWQVATLLDQQGYEWNDSNNTWLRTVDGANFTAVNNGGAYTIDTYNEMNEKGGAIAAVGFNVVAGYENPEAALRGNAKCSVEDSFFDGDSGVAIFYGPSMKEYLAIIGPASESTTQFMIFSQEAVGSGMLDQMMGEQVGGSFTDVWQALTGKSSYGH